MKTNIINRIISQIQALQRLLFLFIVVVCYFMRKIIDIVVEKLNNSDIRVYDSEILREMSKLNENEIRKILDDDEEFIKGYKNTKIINNIKLWW